MAPPVTGLIIDALGFLTGSALYAMLIVMVWRERRGERAPLLSRRGRLPLLTGLFGLVWNVGALLSFGTRVMGRGGPLPALEALAFGALGCLPAVVVHSLIEGREATLGRAVTRPVIVIAYAVSAAAVLMHVSAALRGAVVPSRPALWLLTGAFAVLTGALLLVTRRQPLGRRGIWAAALALFAVSALHFGNHVNNESWWVELVGHHASLPLALAILLQDYRFALADLFLKNAIALLLLMALSVGLFFGLVAPLLQWYASTNGQDPRAIALIVLVWMAGAMGFPLLRRLANDLVDRFILRRPDYPATLNRLRSQLEVEDTEDGVVTALSDAIEAALGVADHLSTADVLPDADGRLVVIGQDVRLLGEPVRSAAVRLRTVEAPHRAIVLGAPAAGRRLLSDDVRLLESMSRLGARRIDVIRVAQERLERNLREQHIEQLAKEAELRALRAQLNPHFLFNALTTIGYLIQSAPTRALDTLLRLTTVLRSVLRRTTAEFTTLGEEIEFVRSYLEIERARFEERLEVVFDVDPRTRAAVVPTLLLQPLVENAIKHGLAPRHRGGRVTIAAHQDATRLTIRVTDTGVGFDANLAHARPGLGLTSIAQRLRACYGAEAVLRIQSTTTAGTTIDISIPTPIVADAPSLHRRKTG